MIGSGGHATLLTNILKEQETNVDIGVVNEKDVDNENRLSDEKFLKLYKNHEVLLINGVGHLPKSKIRKSLYKKYKNLGYKFSSVISTKALITGSVTLDEGVQILPGAIINHGTIIGKNTIINSGAVVEHNCNIGANCHVAPSATVCGNVIIKDNVFVGSNSTIIQNIIIPENCVVKAGDLITKNI